MASQPLLLDQMWEVLRLKHLSFRTEDISVDYHRYPRQPCILLDTRERSALCNGTCP
jgi:hypothetical protein